MLPIIRQREDSEDGVIHCLEMIREGFLEKGKSELFFVFGLFLF